MSFAYNIYFTERSQNRVWMWNPESSALTVAAGAQPDQLQEPYGLVMGHEGNLIICDKLHNRLCVLEGNHLRRMDTHADATIGIDFPIHPTSVIPDSDGSYLVTYSGHDILCRIQRCGALELISGLSPQSRWCYDNYLPEISEENLLKHPLFTPTGLTRSPAGEIYFIERLVQNARRYVPGVGMTCIFQTAPQDEHRTIADDDMIRSLDCYYPQYPTSLAVGPDNKLYFSDASQRCIWRLDDDLNRVCKVAMSKAPVSEIELAGPFAITFSPVSTTQSSPKTV